MWLLTNMPARLQLGERFKHGRSEMRKRTKKASRMPDTFNDLEVPFGGPSDDAFGSAVFRRPMPPGVDIESLARAVYRDFVGELWDRFGPDVWLGEWAELVARGAAAQGLVLDLLASISDPAGQSAADMLVNGAQDPDAAKTALVNAFDRTAVSELRAFRIGDGAAMSGLVIAGRDDETGEAAFVVFLMD